MSKLLILQTGCVKYVNVVKMIAINTNNMKYEAHGADRVSNCAIILLFLWKQPSRGTFFINMTEKGQDGETAVKPKTTVIMFYSRCRSH